MGAVEIDWLLTFGNNMYFFLLSYTILGAGIKYIDAAYDDTTFSKNMALGIAPFLGVLWAYTMIINPISATILLAVLLGVLVKGKIDNYAYIIGFSVILVITLLVKVELMILPLIFLATAAVLDELGNDITDNNTKRLRYKRFKQGLALYFFGRRYLMKVALLYLVLLNIFPLYFLLLLIFFDEAYIIVELYSQSKTKNIKKATKS